MLKKDRGGGRGIPHFSVSFSMLHCLHTTPIKLSFSRSPTVFFIGGVVELAMLAFVVSELPERLTCNRAPMRNHGILAKEPHKTASRQGNQHSSISLRFIPSSTSPLNVAHTHSGRYHIHHRYMRYGRKENQNEWKSMTRLRQRRKKGVPHGARQQRNNNNYKSILKRTRSNRRFFYVSIHGMIKARDGIVFHPHIQSVNCFVTLLSLL